MNPKWFDLFKFIFMALYAAGFTGASFWFFFKIVFGTIPDDNQQYANLILGFLIGSGISTFLGYYYGMSQSVASRKGEPQVPFDLCAEFDKATADKPLMAKYLDALADIFKKTVNEIKMEAMKNLPAFLAGYDKWAAERKET